MNDVWKLCRYEEKCKSTHPRSWKTSNRTNGKRPIMKYNIVKVFKDEGKSWKQKVKKLLNLYTGTSVTETINFLEMNRVRRQLEDIGKVLKVYKKKSCQKS